MIDKDKIVAFLNANGFPVKLESRYRTYAYRIKLESGTAVYLYDKGGFSCQGREANQVRDTIESCLGLNEPNFRVFVVYGHDAQAKQSLLLLLEKWGLEPLCIDNLPSEGRTIIEQLEAYIPQANYGIVLMTPDDLAHSALGGPFRYRARQNVVLELGMLFMKLGRKRVAIVSQKCEGGIEHPSDIDGVLRIEYRDSLEEVSGKLIQELNLQGYSIPRL